MRIDSKMAGPAPDGDRSKASTRLTRERNGKKIEFVWDGIRDSGEDMRYSIIPGRAVDDQRLTRIHFRILAYLGRFNSRRGWCRLSQTKLAQKFDVRRQAVNKAVGELVQWRHIEKQSQAESGESFCLYRILIDQPEMEECPLSRTPPSDESVSVESDTCVRSQETPESPRKDTLNRSLEHIEQSAEAEEVCETDADSLEKLPFSADAIREVVALGEDPVTLFKRYRARTKRKRIRDPSAYFITMARDAAAKRLGVPIAVLIKAAARNDPETGTVFASVVGAFSTPSPRCLARARRYLNPNVDAALQDLSRKKFCTQEAADRAFEGVLTALRFSTGDAGRA
jgi:hypothetical protein